MTPTLFWIDGPWPGRLAISPRPRGGDWLEDELKGWKESGVGIVASLLERSELSELNLSEEGSLVQKLDLKFMEFPIPDRGVPKSEAGTLKFLRDLERELATGKQVVIHCRQGLGRSAMIAAGLLVLEGIDPQTAVSRVSAARGTKVPETLEQFNWAAQIGQEASQLHATL